MADINFSHSHIWA